METAEAVASVAYAGALVGEPVMDVGPGTGTGNGKPPRVVHTRSNGISSSNSNSNSNYRQNSTRTLYSNERMRQLLTKQHYAGSDCGSTGSVSSDCSDFDGLNLPSLSGIMSGAKGWLGRQRERRQKALLARQVEDQRQKLKAQARDGILLFNNYNHYSDENRTTAINASDEVSANTDGTEAATAKSPHKICGIGMGMGMASEDDDSDQEQLSGDEDDDIHIGEANGTVSGEGISVNVHIQNDDYAEEVLEVSVEPEPPSKHPFCKHILSQEQMRILAMKALPVSVRYSRWKRVYCLARDGDSFAAAFLPKVSKEPRTLLVIRTTRGEVFGGYADSKWESQSHSLGANFYGSAQGALFKIQSQTSETDANANTDTDTDTDTSATEHDEQSTNIKVFKWAGVNRYIQLCDVHSRMLAFGGGGAGGTFGLCIENDFQRGSTGACDTFGNEPLCSQENFEILDFEAWALMTGRF